MDGLLSAHQSRARGSVLGHTTLTLDDSGTDSDSSDDAEITTVALLPQALPGVQLNPERVELIESMTLVVRMYGASVAATLQDQVHKAIQVRIA